MDEEAKDKAWEEEKVSRAEMLELMLPLVLCSAYLAKSLKEVGLAMVKSGDEDLAAAGMKSLTISDDAKRHLRDFQAKYKELAGKVDDDSGDQDAAQSKPD